MRFSLYFLRMKGIVIERYKCAYNVYFCFFLLKYASLNGAFLALSNICIFQPRLCTFFFFILFTFDNKFIVLFYLISHLFHNLKIMFIHFFPLETNLHLRRSNRIMYKKYKSYFIPKKQRSYFYLFISYYFYC